MRPLLRRRRPLPNVTQAADGSMPSGSRETISELQPTDYEHVVRLAIERDPAAVRRALIAEGWLSASYGTGELRDNAVQVLMEPPPDLAVLDPTLLVEVPGAVPVRHRRADAGDAPL